MSIWGTLGLEPGADIKAIKKAYASRLKQCRPDQNPEGYQQLREAYDAALRIKKAQQSRQSVPRESVVTTITPPQEPESPLLSQPVIFDGSSGYQPPEPKISEAELAEMRAAQERRERLEAMHRSATETAQDFLTQAGANDALAAEQLDALLESPEVANLDVRQSFELALAHGLAAWQGANYPHETAAKIIQTFFWERQGRRTGGLSLLFDRVRRRRQLAEIHRQLAEEAEQQRWWRRRDPRPLAAAAILNPGQKGVQRRAFASNGVVKQLGEYLKQLRVFSDDMLAIAFDLDHLSALEQKVDGPRFGVTNIVAGILGGLFLGGLVVPILSGIYIDSLDSYLIPESAQGIATLISIVLVTALIIYGLAYVPLWIRRSRRKRNGFLAMRRTYAEMLWFQAATRVLLIGLTLLGPMPGAWDWIRILTYVAIFAIAEPLPILAGLWAGACGFIWFMVGTAPIDQSLVDESPVLFMVTWAILHPISISLLSRFDVPKLRLSTRFFWWAHYLRMFLFGLLVAFINQLIQG